MSDKDRKHYITHIALAIHTLARRGLDYPTQIIYFADAIVSLADMPDSVIKDGKRRYDAILDEAKEINNRPNPAA